MNNTKMLNKKRNEGFISSELTCKIIKKEKDNAKSKNSIIKAKKKNLSKSSVYFDEELQESRVNSKISHYHIIHLQK